MSNLTGVIGSISGLSGSVASTSGLSGTITTDSSYPIATGVNITGTMKDGEVATGNYTYYDADGDLEGVSTFRWLSDDDGAGTGKAAIGGATSQTYTIQVADVGKYLYFEVTPVALTGYSPGVAVESAPSVQVEASFDADALAIINAMTTTPDAARQALIDDFVVAGKAHGWWVKGRWLHVYAAHAQDSSLLNWFNPGTYDGTAVIAPNFTIDSGWDNIIPATSYLDSGYNPSLDGVVSTANIGFVYGISSVEPSNVGYAFGCTNGTNETRSLYYYSGKTYGQIRNTGQSSASVAAASSVGHRVIVRENNNVTISYNKSEALAVSTLTALPNLNEYVLGVNSSGALASPARCMMPYAGGTEYMTQAERDYFIDDMETFLDAIGAGLIP